MHGDIELSVLVLALGLIICSGIVGLAIAFAGMQIARALRSRNATLESIARL
jgi:site-specific recombinase